MNYLTVPQVAKRYGVARDKVYSWINSGRLAAIDVGTGRASYRISPEALTDLDAKCRVIKIKPAKRARQSGVIQFF